MNDIIKQIIEIDSVAFEKKNSNEELLIKKKQEYEYQISSYRKEKIEEAKKRAQIIADNVDVYIKESEKQESEKLVNISSIIDTNYKKSENELVDTIFNKIFALEG